MNEIVMIPVEQLIHHPENPRKNLGDLTELAESIRKNGIMQNLTVVRGHMIEKEEWIRLAKAEGVCKEEALSTWDPNAWDPTGYTVVIGNRRMEAAKAAGLKEVPCVVSDMDYRTQIATMLEENMQRADLTVYEQAQGFQMMMDLGYRPEEISERTGFSETTVRRRLKMAELDKDAFRKATGKQITMDDLDRLAKIDSIKERNALLKEYGGNDFNWKLNQAIKVQDATKRKPAAHRMLQEAKVEKLPDNEKYSGKYQQIYHVTCDLYEWDGKKNIIPKTEGKLFYTEDALHIYFYEKVKKNKKDGAQEKTAEEKEQEKRIALAWKTVDRCGETAAELRAQYAKGMTVSPKNAMRMMQWALVAAFTSMLNYETPTMTLKKRMEIKGNLIPDAIAEMTKKVLDLPQSRWPELILMMFTGDYEARNGKPPAFADGYRGDWPKYKKNVALESCYEWLTEFGYEMSTEEIGMMSGTHEVFQTEVKA